MTWRRHGPAALLALLAYLPALLAAPGRMPADSKLYLYLDPGGFLGDAASTFDPGQFAGWVPHQHVSYLWPAGPWFWWFETIGVPDWIAHRLWIGTIMLAAGLGARWCARLLGLGAAAALTAAVVYQASPYVLPYVSRTSVMLLPWAGLGWIVGFTVRATARRTWGDPAAIALVVVTVGAVNATALAMIVPAPVLWLLHEVWRRTIGWRQAVLVAGRTAVLALGVSLWWITALVIQGRYGAEVLPYSESLADVSLTATSPEVWRGLGYWLFYVRDPFLATTTESLRYLSSTPAIVISFLVPVVCLIGLVWVRWAHRRFAAALVVVGGVLAVGVHPVDDRSPLMRLLAGSDDGGLALALRSSTRALPLLFLGLALGAAALVESAPRTPLPRLPRLTGHAASTAVIGALVLVNLPGLWTGAFVDPALERDQDPPDAWRAAAASLDDGGRVLMLPGVEFGAYRWGYTVDQPLPGLTDAPLVTRDLLPLGSPAAMDLLYAFDDRIQDGVLEPASIAPIARLLGAGTIWSTNDLAFDRFRTARPEVVRSALAAADGVGALIGFGEPVANAPSIPMLDESALGDPRVGRPLPPVELAPVDGASIVRAKDTTVVVSGSGEGLVDLAAAGLLDGDEAIRYSASLDGAPDAPVTAVLVTDSHRARARHWRSSQDTRGFTEPGPSSTGLFERPASDQRLPVVEDPAPDSFSYAQQRSAVTASASSYGEPFAYLPEHRPFMAVDGDPATAWLVGEHGDPIGETLRLDLAPGATTTEMRLHQPSTDGNRRITSVRIAFADDTGEIEGRDVALDERSVAGGGLPVSVPDIASRISITITGVGGGEPFAAGAVAGVGFSEVELGLAPGAEVVRVPTDGLDLVDAETPLAYSFTRWRVDPMDRWRDDPEPSLVRSFEVPGERRFEPILDVRLDARADDRELADLFAWPAAASTRLTGSLANVGATAFDGDPGTAWITAFGEAEGAVLAIDGVADPITEISITQPPGEFSAVRSVRVSVDDEERIAAIAPSGTTDVVLDPPLPPGRVEITLIDVDEVITIDRRHGDPVALPAAVSEVVFAGAPTIDLDAAPVLECVPLVEVGDVVLAATVDLTGWRDRTLRGEPLDTTPCTDAVELADDVLVTAVDPGNPLQLDRLVLDDGARVALSGASTATADVVDDERFQRTVEVSGCAAGCWLVLGEGFNDGWSADAQGRDLGAPVLVDGGFNGWWLEPGVDRVTVTWGPQRWQNAAFLLSLLAAGVALVLVVLDRRRAAPPVLSVADRPTWSWERRPTGQPPWLVAMAWAVPALLLAGPVWGLLGLAGGLVAGRYRTVPLAALTSLVTVGVIGLAVAYVERRDAPFPGGGWPTAFESLHWVGMFAFAALAASALTDAD